MQRSAVCLILRFALFAFVAGGCGADRGEDETLGVAEEGTEVSRAGRPIHVLPPDTAGYPLSDELQITGEAPPPREPVVPAPAATCNPNYEPCVPIDSDVDCEGRGGNGPSYVSGPVRVIGRDVYRLDRDGDGVGCEN